LTVRVQILLLLSWRWRLPIMAESTKELTDEGAKVTTTVEGSDATAAAPAEPKKGYWIIHILSINNEEKFFAHLSLANSKTKYGGKTRIFAPVKATLKGDPVAYCAVIEFPSVQAAIDCWADPEDYAEARALLGDPETAVVDRRVCVIEADPLPELKPGQGFWCWRSVEFGVASMASSSTPSMRRVPYTQDQPRPRRQRPGEVHGLRGSSDGADDIGYVRPGGAPARRRGRHLV